MSREALQKCIIDLAASPAATTKAVVARTSTFQVKMSARDASWVPCTQLENGEEVEISRMLPSLARFLGVPGDFTDHLARTNVPLLCATTQQLARAVDMPLVFQVCAGRGFMNQSGGRDLTGRQEIHGIPDMLRAWEAVCTVYGYEPEKFQVDLDQGFSQVIYARDQEILAHKGSPVRPCVVLEHRLGHLVPALSHGVVWRDRRAVSTLVGVVNSKAFRAAAEALSLYELGSGTLQEFLEAGIKVDVSRVLGEKLKELADRGPLSGSQVLKGVRAVLKDSSSLAVRNSLATRMAAGESLNHLDVLFAACPGDLGQHEQISGYIEFLARATKREIKGKAAEGGASPVAVPEAPVAVAVPEAPVAVAVPEAREAARA